jgi:hypothetical protein
LHNRIASERNHIAPKLGANDFNIRELLAFAEFAEFAAAATIQPAEVLVTTAVETSSSTVRPSGCAAVCGRGARGPDGYPWGAKICYADDFQSCLANLQRFFRTGFR